VGGRTSTGLGARYSLHRLNLDFSTPAVLKFTGDVWLRRWVFIALSIESLTNGLPG
jgi:hypothetical protein